VTSVLGSGRSNCMVFLTGYSGAGKSTIAKALSEKLSSAVVIEGDTLRQQFKDDLAHGNRGAETNMDRLIAYSLLLFKTNQHVISAFVAPRADLREKVKEAMTREGCRYIEVFLNTPIEECEKRDPKELYRKMRRGEDIRLAGLNESYDEPQNPDLICNTAIEAVEDVVSRILEKIAESPFR